MIVHAVVLFLLFPFRRQKEKPSKDHEKLLQEGGSSSGGGGGVQRKTVRVPAKIVPWKSGIGGGGGVVDQEVAVRRALAIRRVLQGDEVDSAREFSLFVTSRGDTLFTQSWTPVSGKIRY